MKYWSSVAKRKNLSQNSVFFGLSGHVALFGQNLPVLTGWLPCPSPPVQTGIFLLLVVGVQ